LLQALKQPPSRGIVGSWLGPRAARPSFCNLGDGVFAKHGLSIVGFWLEINQLSVKQHQACSKLFDLLVISIKLILCSRNQQSERQRGK
jgi:hypothetical protein